MREVTEGEKKPPEQTALVGQFCLFNATVMTDTTRPGVCLEENIYSPSKATTGSSAQFWIIFTAQLLKYCQAKLCCVIKLLYYLYGEKELVL